jgi:hypothetical protein
MSASSMGAQQVEANILLQMAKHFTGPVHGFSLAAGVAAWPALVIMTKKAPAKGLFSRNRCQ